MNFIDIFIAIPLLWAIYKGFTKGFILAVASFVGFWLGIWGSIRFSAYLIPLLKDKFEITSTYLPIAAFFLCFLLILLIVYLFARLLQTVVEGMALGLLNKIGGAVFNFLKYALVLSVFIFILNSVEKEHPLLPPQLKKESLLYNALSKVAPTIIPALDTFKQQFRYTNLN